MDKWLLTALIVGGVNTLANIGEGIACGVINGKADSASITAKEAKALAERNNMAIAGLYQELGLVQQQNSQNQQTQQPPVQVQSADSNVVNALEKMTKAIDKMNDKLDNLSK